MAQAEAIARSSGGGPRNGSVAGAAGGRVRLAAFLPVELCAALRAADADWRPDPDGRALELAEPPPELARAVGAALAEAGLEPPSDLRLMRHRPGGHGLPPGVGLVIDLNLGWRSADGGLLLFEEADGRTVGWRPEAGAATLFEPARPPVLSLVAPGAPEPRLALVGGFG